MNPRALFIAPAYHEAAYWARQWGFGPTEWTYLTPVLMYGLRNDDGDGIVYVCGSRPLDDGIVSYLRSVGFDTYVDAHDHPTDAEPRSALDHMPR